MKRKLIVLTLLLLSLTNLLRLKTYATEDLNSSSNNKVGVHILFTSELQDAAGLINSNGGDWGYVTIPIQAGDKDLIKWQEFMDNAKGLHIIPIIRLSTEGDYFINSIWRKPNFDDVLDFANFLNSLDWPVKNRYVVVFNEVNRNDEWGGDANAAEYALILSYAAEVFKAKNSDFFVISAGLDNASENNEYIFMQEMDAFEPKIFTLTDGIASHSYPNPGFEQPPWVKTRKSISSFTYELQLAELLADKKLPVFITETGWSSDKVPKKIIGDYYTEAFESVWSSDKVIAVTPFLFNAGAGPFVQFSLIDKNGEKSEIYNAIKNIPKIKGNPELTKPKFTENQDLEKTDLPIMDFSSFRENDNTEVTNKVDIVVELVRWILKV